MNFRASFSGGPVSFGLNKAFATKLITWHCCYNRLHIPTSPLRCLIKSTLFRHLEPTSTQIRNISCCSSSRSIGFDNSKASVPVKKDVSLWPKLRALMFYFWATILACPFFVSMVLILPFVLLFDRHRRRVFSSINCFWASLSCLPFFSIEVEGRENLPRPNEASVYVANHQSYLDIFSLLVLNRPFKFISKPSIFLFPFAGWSMFLTGHIMLNRTDRRSQVKCLKQCQSRLKTGASVCFFPEGTRSENNRIQPFKKGAFSVAVNTGCSVVPISLTGTGELMKKSRELELFPGEVKIKIHHRIQSKDMDAGTLCKQTQNTIVSGL